VTAQESNQRKHLPYVGFFSPFSCRTQEKGFTSHLFDKHQFEAENPPCREQAARRE